MGAEMAQGQGASAQASGADKQKALAKTTKQTRTGAVCGAATGARRLRQCVQTMHRLRGVGFTADTDDPEGGHSQDKPEAFSASRGGNARPTPLPAASLEVFEAAFHPGA